MVLVTSHDEAVPPVAMGKFSATKQHGDCEEVANPSTAYGRRRRNWIEAHGSLQVKGVGKLTTSRGSSDEGSGGAEANEKQNW
jgi:hypothetical protein